MKKTLLSPAVFTFALFGAHSIAYAGGIQNYTGDTCTPAGRTSGFSLNSGSIINNTGTQQAYICPLHHINSDFFSSTGNYRPSVFMTISGGGFTCSPVATTTAIYNPSFSWGVAKQGSSGALSWLPSELPYMTAVSFYQQVSIVCTVNPGGRIWGYVTL
jgi:hypothetical protein